MIHYDMHVFTCNQKLTSCQLSLSHDI